MMKGKLSYYVLATVLPATLAAHAQQLPMRLWYDRPAQYFEESLPIGNGKLGALIYGGTDTCLIHLNDITSLADAEEVVGRGLFIEGEWEEEEELDFTGWTLLNRGVQVGTVTGMEPIPGNLCLYVGDALVPLHEDLIISADPATRTLNLNLPDGLL